MLYSLSERRAYMGFKCCGPYGNLLQPLKFKCRHELSWMLNKQQCQCCLAVTTKIVRFLLPYSQAFVNFVGFLHTMLYAVLQENSVFIWKIRTYYWADEGGESIWKWMKFYAVRLDVAPSCYAYELLSSLLNPFTSARLFTWEWLWAKACAGG